MAHKSFSPKAFMRKTDHGLLSRYFSGKSISVELDPKKPEKDRYYFAWRDMDEVVKNQVEEDFKKVNDLATDRGRWYLNRKAEDIWVGDAAGLQRARDMCHHDLAMTLFLDHLPQFEWAYDWQYMDNLVGLKDFKGRYPKPITTSQEKKEQLRDAWRDFLVEEAKGERCSVEDFQGTDKFALVIYHEDYVRPVDRFDDHENVIPDLHRPVVKVAAFFYPEDQVLKVKAPGKAAVEKVRDLFAEIFAEDPDYFVRPETNDRFDFAPLKDTEFDFVTNGADQIEFVRLVGLTFSAPVAGKPTISIAAKEDLRDGTLDNLGFSLDSLEIRGVKIQFKFPGANQRAGSRTASLSLPNSSNLGDIKNDRTIRSYLRSWGVEKELDHDAARS